MTARVATIRTWFRRAKDRGATHIIAWFDFLDREDWPEYCFSEREARERYKESGKGDGIIVEAVYKVDDDMEIQLATRHNVVF